MATGNDILKLAAKHLGEPYVLGVVAPKKNPSWNGPWDCAEFASWCVYQASGVLYGCDNNTNPALADAYTGYWQRDSSSVGKVISVAAAATIPGAAVLRAPQPGMIGHIVFSDGKGGTIEAHSSKKGVIRSTLSQRRWDTAILVPGIQYVPTAAPAPVSAPLLVLRLTSPQMQGKLVKEVQRKLKKAGFNPGVIDGIYGPSTVAAVNAFQVSEGLVPDGEVADQTALALGIDLPS